jgi:glycerol-3-phosphate dehydrogenase
MMKVNIAAVTLFALAIAVPASGKTYKSTYPVPCTDVWGAVQETLNHPDQYEVLKKDDAQMHAEYNVKHEAHVTITGVFTQRTNKVTLVPQGGACEMQVVSNFSGWEHTDRADFKKRVDDNLAKAKGAGPAAQPAEEAKPTQK